MDGQMKADGRMDEGIQMDDFTFSGNIHFLLYHIKSYPHFILLDKCRYAIESTFRSFKMPILHFIRV